jgi:hypothetical protein
MEEPVGRRYVPASPRCSSGKRQACLSSQQPLQARALPALPGSIRKLTTCLETPHMVGIADRNRNWPVVRVASVTVSLAVAVAALVCGSLGTAQAGENPALSGLTDGLVGYWDFGACTGKTVRNLSPVGNDGTITDGEAVAEKGGRSLAFDGVCTSVAIPARIFRPAQRAIPAPTAREGQPGRRPGFGWREAASPVGATHAAPAMVAGIALTGLGCVGCAIPKAPLRSPLGAHCAPLALGATGLHPTAGVAS